MKNSFIWNKDFETGLPSVDEQHHYLVDLINQFSELVFSQNVKDVDITSLFAELADYTHYHFREEEELMEASGMHPLSIREHRVIHEGFSEKLKIMDNQLHINSAEFWEVLLNFLYQWLGHHILGLDHAMAREMSFLKEGMDSEKARSRVRENSEHDPVNPMLHALSRMIDLLAAQNADMNTLNLHLEEMVRERTAELQKANERLEIISMTDTLTGLPNRRHAMEKLQFLWSESEQKKKPLSCMMIDADYFKEVNDKYGHDAGDRVLCELGKKLVHSARTDDVVCRMGGDEFFIICPNTDIAGCFNLANQLLERVKTMVVHTGDGRWRSSISIGVAQKTSSMKIIENLIKISDESVYEAKEAGRGCVRSVQENKTIIQL